MNTYFGSKIRGLSIHPDEPFGESDVFKNVELYHWLTRREIEVVAWVARGKTNKEIGDIFNISPQTVSKHLANIFIKLGVESRTGAVVWVYEIMQHAQEPKSREVYTEIS